MTSWWRAFGAGPITDAFWVAFRIPNLLRRLFAEGAFAQAFVPILGAARNNRSDNEVRTLLDRVALLLTLALMLVTLVGIVAAPWVVSAMASRLRGAARDAEFGAAVWMTRVMFPYILCMSLIAFASGVLNTWRRFAVPAFTPVLLNLSMIAACLWLAPRMDVPGWPSASWPAAWRSWPCNGCAGATGPDAALRCACARPGPTPPCSASSSRWRRPRWACPWPRSRC